MPTMMEPYLEGRLRKACSYAIIESPKKTD
jgi:hypothetical protein